MRMELHRKKMLVQLFVSTIFAILVISITLWLRAFPLTILLSLLIAWWIAWIFSQLERFRRDFKPNIIRLILDFVDNDVNFGTLQYVQNKSIGKKEFVKSKLFNSATPEFSGEDYIHGKVGEMDFEMSELSVKNFSNIRNRLDDVFVGVFLHATYKQQMEGDLIIFPRKRKPEMTRTIKSFTRQKGWEVLEGKNPAFSNRFIGGFSEAFVAYATREARPELIMSEEMQKVFLDYQNETGKELYVSFVGRDIYIALSQTGDLFEPVLWRSNVSFDLILEYYTDLKLLTNIVLDIDAHW
jgi:hypothetical protein